MFERDIFEEDVEETIENSIIIEESEKSNK